MKECKVRTQQKEPNAHSQAPAVKLEAPDSDSNVLSIGWMILSEISSWASICKERSLIEVKELN